MLKPITMKKTTGTLLPFALLVGLLPISLPAPGAHAAVPSRGAEIPWTTYEAEDMTTNATVLGPRYDPNTEEIEASGQKAVKLDSTGKYVQFTAQGAANAIVIRYSLPDSPGGGGIDATLSLYKNGTFVQKVPMTSKYSRLYGAYPFTNNPGGGTPRNFYDEVRLKLGTINPGDVIKLQKDSGDSASYYTIDFVDLENVAPPLARSANFLSITDYGAVGNGSNDDTGALNNTINAAKAQGKGVWIPAGTYKIRGTFNLSDIKIQGAGIWHSTFVGDDNYYDGNRIRFNGAGNNVLLSDFAITGKLDYRSDSEANDGIIGSFGTGSVIRNLWIEHTKVGAWVTNSDGLRFEGMRFRNTIADGINSSVGTRNTLIYNSTARGTGDDAFAIWPAEYEASRFEPGFNVIKNVTAQLPWLAHGAAVYGGDSNRVEDSVFKDIPHGAGVLISSTFPGKSFSGTTTVQRNDIIRGGGYDHGFGWRGALQFVAHFKNISGFNINNLNITDALSSGIQFQSAGSSQSNTTIDQVKIQRPGLRGQGYGIVEMAGALGNATISNTSVTNPAQGGWQDLAPGFTITPGPGNSGWSGGTTPTPGSSNLALGQPIMESGHTQVYGAANANDGNPATYWEGNANAYPNWLTVDMGSSKSITKVVLQLPPSWGSRNQTLSIEGSTNGSAFTTIVPSATYTFNPSSNEVTITFPATTTRYVRVNFTANSGATGGQVSEFQVY
ncbi:discoidin domain-containing protein [Paenibacillus filicis]|uniref:Discoidin domain-containing protein n=1 Tax=Paenibacillus filicis TaxID=669464 RepID=A0ABU9DIL1_9BACL